MARNISNILSEESYLGKNVDPAAGSYYLESATAELVSSVLKHINTPSASNSNQTKPTVPVNWETAEGISVPQ